MLFSSIAERFRARRMSGRSTSRFAIDELHDLPGDLRTPEPGFADELAAGHMGLAGSSVATDNGSVFVRPAPTETFARALHGFGWLRHLDAARSVEAEDLARQLLLQWVATRRQHAPIAREPMVRVRRVLSWLSHANVALTSADAADYDAITAAIGDEVAGLAMAAPAWPHGPATLLARVALIEACLCTRKPEAERRRFEQHLLRECEGQILADGGHISRNPAVVIELLLDLVPLRQLYIATATSPPPELGSAIERMRLFLASMRHGDGTMARFHGMAATPLDEVATLLAQTPVQSGSCHCAPSGYARLEAGKAVVIVDTGGLLSLEMSAGGMPLIVNRGGGRDDGPLGIADQSTLGLGLTQPAPKPIPIAARFDADAGMVSAEHAGYRAGCGLVHRRTVTLAADGRRLDGVDLLAGEGTAAKRDFAAAVRFHLHPSVRAEQDAAGRVTVTAANGMRWMFAAEAGVVAVEASTFYATCTGPKPALQIVVHARMPATPEIRWSFAAA